MDTESSGRTEGISMPHGTTSHQRSESNVSIMNLPDIDGLDVPALQELATKIVLRIDDLRTRGIAELRQNILDQATSLGVSAEDILGVATRKKPRARKAKSKQED